jgi:hypothetical protein
MKTFQELTWRLRALPLALGVPGALAAIFIVGIASAYLLVLLPMREEIATIKSDIIRFQSKSRASLQVVRILNPTEQLAEFYRFFPTQDRISEEMEKIYNAADEQGVTLERGDYQLVSERDSKLLRYDISLPIKGGYLPVRKFVTQILKDVPSASLLGIVFTRDRISDPLLDVQLKFALYVKPS